MYDDQRLQLVYLLSKTSHIWIIRKWKRNKNLKRWCYLQWLHTWQQWQVHCFVLQSSLAWNFWFQACAIWWRTISDPTEMVLLSVHVLAALYAWANEATNTKKKRSIIYNSVINSFAETTWIIVESFSLLRILNVYVHRMWIDVICYQLNTLSLKLFKFFFQQLHWFLQLWSCSIKWYKKGWRIKLCIHNVVAKCLHILSETETLQKWFTEHMHSTVNEKYCNRSAYLYQNSFAVDIPVTRQFYKIITSSWIPPWPESLQPSVIQITIAGST